MMCHCVVLWVCRRFAATPSRHPRRSYWNEFAAEAYSLLPFSNEGGRLLTYDGEAVIGREAMFAEAQQQHSEFLTQLLERLMTDEETCYEEEKHFLVLDLKTLFSCV